MRNATTLCGLLLTFVLAAPARAQLPFDVSRSDLLQIDTAAVRWKTLRTFVGGAEGAVEYLDRDVTEGECRAVTLLALRRLQNVYAREREAVPVSVRLSFLCGTSYIGNLHYDGLSLTLVQRDRTTGEIIYRGRRSGLP